MANKQKLSTTINKSIITKLRDQNKLNDSLLVLISNLTLEDLIAIKLELSCNLINNGVNGYLAHHSMSWYNYMKILTNDQKLREVMGLKFKEKYDYFIFYTISI